MVRTTSVQGGANGANTITIMPVAGCRHRLHSLLWSYSATPIGGKVSTTGLWEDDLDHDIIYGGPGELVFPPIEAEHGAALVVALAAGGGGVSGQLTALYSTE
jgi:hypothetical protein